MQLARLGQQTAMSLGVAQVRIYLGAGTDLSAHRPHPMQTSSKAMQSGAPQLTNPHGDVGHIEAAHQHEGEHQHGCGRGGVGRAGAVRPFRQAAGEGRVGAVAPWTPCLPPQVACGNPSNPSKAMGPLPCTFTIAEPAGQGIPSREGHCTCTNQSAPATVCAVLTTIAVAPISRPRVCCRRQIECTFGLSSAACRHMDAGAQRFTAAAMFNCVHARHAAALDARHPNAAAAAVHTPSCQYKHRRRPTCATSVDSSTVSQLRKKYPPWRSPPIRSAAGGGHESSVGRGVTCVAQHAQQRPMQGKVQFERAARQCY